MSKIDQGLVDVLFHKNIGYARREVSQGPAYGVDCAVIDLPEGQAMVTASDPMSYIPTIGIRESAYISLHLAANDIATSGLTPQYGQCVFNLPKGMSRDALTQYWRCINDFAKELGIHITGGHTGWDVANQTTIIGGITLFSIGNKQDVLLSNQAKAGDVLLMTKSAGIISTSVLGMSFPHFVTKHLGIEVLKRLQRNIWSISVVPEGKIIGQVISKARFPNIHAMHDVTEGGVLGAVYEFAQASKLGVTVFSDQIHVENEIEQTAQLFGLDAKEIIGAGSMLIACEPEAKNSVINMLAQSHIKCTEIGRFCSPEQGLNRVEKGRMRSLQVAKRDPYWEVFTNCIQNGLS